MEIKENIVIGWSCWGFLGDGIADTPDGGRCHRLPLIRQLIKKGCSIIMLQQNRDYTECGQYFAEEGLSFSKELPEIDLLFLEYRWPIPGRNCCVDEMSESFTPDLKRQNELISFYRSKHIPIIAWDKDQKLPQKEEYLFNIIMEASLLPNDNRVSLLFPMSNEIQKKFVEKIVSYDKEERDIDIVYIGNQYERDETFKKYFNDVLSKQSFENAVFGNWTKYVDQKKKNKKKFPLVNFQDRIAYSKIYEYYKRSLVTPLIAPDRYYKSGQITQRLFEAIGEQCVPLFPGEYCCVTEVAIPELIVYSSNDVYLKICELREMSNSDIAELLKRQFNKIQNYAVDIQADNLILQIKKLLQ